MKDSDLRIMNSRVIEVTAANYYYYYYYYRLGPP